MRLCYRSIWKKLRANPLLILSSLGVAIRFCGKRCGSTSLLTSKDLLSRFDNAEGGYSNQLASTQALRPDARERYQWLMSDTETLQEGKAAEAATKKEAAEQKGAGGRNQEKKLQKKWTGR